jgi:hypothetical protein
MTRRRSDRGAANWQSDGWIAGRSMHVRRARPASFFNQIREELFLPQRRAIIAWTPPPVLCFYRSTATAARRAPGPITGGGRIDIDIDVDAPFLFLAVRCRRLQAHHHWLVASSSKLTTTDWAHAATHAAAASPSRFVSARVQDKATRWRPLRDRVPFVCSDKQRLPD